MTVYFIGAGPGAADLITVRGQRLLSRCPVCLYAGSIMPEDLLALCPPDARVIDTGPLNLDQIITELADAHAAGLDVARLHSGDPSIYSALAEQCRRLDALGVDYEIVPGVPAFAAAAAVLGRELTVPGVAQTVTLTRVATLSTAMPPGEDLANALGAGFDARAASGCRADRCDRAATAGRRLRAGNPVCRGGIRHLATGDRAAMHAVRPRRGDEGRRRHPHRGHRGRGCACRRRLFRQLPVLVRTGAAGTALMRVLLLGGTSEARALAARLHPDVDVISSLAGRVPDPALPVGEVRIGGFGGVDGMRRWLVEAAVDAVVDATHPYAATITAHAAAVCDELRLPHLVLARPAWPPGDAIVVGSDAEAAKTVAAERLFACIPDHRAIRHGGLRRRRRLVPDPCGHRTGCGRPCPAATSSCCRAGRTTTTTSWPLLRDHRIEALVTKNSGGAMTRPKLDAAAALGVAVVMVDRPPLPAGVATVATVDDAAELGQIDW